MDDTFLSIQSIRKIAYMCKFWKKQSNHMIDMTVSTDYGITECHVCVSVLLELISPANNEHSMHATVSRDSS